MMHRLIMVAVLVLMAGATVAQSPDAAISEMMGLVRQPIVDWRYSAVDLPDGADPALDDSTWKSGSPEFEWGQEPSAWLRTTVTVPERFLGVSTKGSTVRLICGVDDEGIVFINGKQVARFKWDQGSVVLTEKAVPGEKFVVAIKGINTGGPGRLLSAYLRYGVAEPAAGPAERFAQRWSLARELSGLASEAQRETYSLLLEEAAAAVDVDSLRSGRFDAFVLSLNGAGAALDPIDELMRQMTIHLVGHAHIDMNWLWLWPETIEVCRNTFSTACNLMQEYPFKLSQSQASVYEAVREHDPAVFERIRKAIADGRWEPTVSTWTEGDNNMACGEAIVRSILYGKRYMKKHFGTETRVGWFPDNFGHPWTLPQILAKSGIDYYYFMRCGIGKPVFWWEGPDGSRVLAYNYADYNGRIEPDLPVMGVRFCEATGLQDYMHVYGVGDHGGGPTRGMLSAAQEMAKNEAGPRINYSTASDYFDSIKTTKSDFPVHAGELNTIFEGCYTTHADIKRWNRHSENLLPASEKFCSVASNWGFEYPAEPFEQSWRNTCFNQFHDLLCGSAIHGSYDHSRDLYEKAAAQGESALTAALEHLESRIDTRGEGIPIVVFNPTSWTRTDAINVPTPFSGESINIEIRDERGRSYAARSIGDRLYFTARDVPAVGYRVYWAKETAGSIETDVRASGTLLENQYFRVVADMSRGGVIRIYDKVNKREVLPEGAVAARLQVLLEKGHGMSAWTIGEIGGTHDLAGESEVVLMDSGPALASISWDHLYESSQITQQVFLYDAVPRIDFRLTIDWQEKGSKDTLAPMLKWAVPTGIASTAAVYEIPFGSISRESTGAEVPALNWIDLSGADYGVSILNECKHGFDVRDGVMRATLLRSPYEPDPAPDVGISEATLSIYPHIGDAKKAGTVRRALELNQPLAGIVTKSHPGELPKSQSFVSCEAPNIVVTALKRTEDGGSLVLRFYETDGVGCRANFKLNLPVKRMVETDLMERPIGEPRAVADGSFSVDVGKHEIQTYRLMME